MNAPPSPCFPLSPSLTTEGDSRDGCYNGGVIQRPENAPHFAIHCQYLRRTLEPGRVEQFVALCTHPVREGKECIGPFLEDLQTSCGLWESHPQSQSIPLPQPERWQRRRRREGYDLTRDWR